MPIRVRSMTRDAAANRSISANLFDKSAGGTGILLWDPTRDLVVLNMSICPEGEAVATNEVNAKVGTVADDDAFIVATDVGGTSVAIGTPVSFAASNFPFKLSAGTGLLFTATAVAGNGTFRVLTEYAAYDGTTTKITYP